jgi:perosamine synthetase
MIHVYNSFVHPAASDYVREVLSSTLLSEGRLVEQFEQRLSADLGLQHPVALNSGTSALHLALVLAGIKAGDEVILPAQTFVASGLVIVQELAVPVFADIHYATGNLNPLDIEHRITPRTKAIMAVHWGGMPCDMDEIHAVARRHGLVVIEDAAHALGATYHGRPVGALSAFTCFSFQAIKHVTTGDGGALCLLDPELETAARSRRWFGIDRKRSPMTELGERAYDIQEPGFKYHLNDYAAALGLANLQGFPARLARRRAVARRYQQALAQVSGLQLFAAPSDRESAWWVFGCHVERRSDFIRALNSRGVMASVIHQGIDHNGVFGGKHMDLIQQRRFDETQIHIPLHDGLRDEDVAQVVAAIQKGW